MAWFLQSRHIFFWVITGLICYIIWKDENKKAAKKHLVRSIWLGFVVWILIGFIIGFVSTTQELTNIENGYEGKYIDDTNSLAVSNTLPQTQNNYFIDTNGYTPEWAKNIGEEQALMKCMNLLSENIFEKLTADKKWCNEFSGFLGDEMDKEMSDMGFNFP